MNILMTTQSYYPFLEKGGPAVKVRAIALGLAKLGHHVTVLTADWGFHPSMAPSMSAEKCASDWRAVESGVTTLFLHNLARYRTLSVNPQVLRISLRRSKEKEYDITHVYGIYDLLGPAVTFGPRRNRIPYVVEPMGMFRPIVRNIALKKLYHLSIGRRLVKSAHRFIATSDQEKRELLEEGVGADRIVVRRNGVEPPPVVPVRGAFRKQRNIPPDAKVALYLGRIEEKKSPELLLSAFATWRKNSGGPASFLVIAGPEQKPGYVARLTSMASALDIREAVQFTGPLYDYAKWSAYRDADVFVLPSYNENFGNSAAEAIACGTPVIVSDRCGIAPLVADKTGLVVPHEADAIARALQIILDNPDAAARFRAACQEVVGGLSWDEPVCQMVRIYEEVLSAAAAA